MDTGPNILLLAGTSESAEAATLLAEAGYRVLVSTATDNTLDTGRHANITRRSGRLDASGLIGLIQSHQICALVDVSHPYAEALHRDANLAVAATGIPYIYYERPSACSPTEDVILATCHAEAASIACGTKRPVLLTIGARNVACYAKEAARTGTSVIARVLNDPGSIDACRAAGLRQDAIISGRGPFSLEQNRDLIQRFAIGTLVTKDGGEAGGFSAKQSAARLEGCQLIVVKRPPRSQGIACPNLLGLAEILALNLNQESVMTEDRTGLILLAHGSNNPDWQVPFEALAAELAGTSETFRVQSAYLQLAPPSLPQAIQQMVAEGIRRINVLPMFMAAGNHIKDDIPHEVNTVKEDCPGVDIQILPPIGSHPRFKAMLREIVEEMM